MQGRFSRPGRLQLHRGGVASVVWGAGAACRRCGATQPAILGGQVPAGDEPGVAFWEEPGLVSVVFNAVLRHVPIAVARNVVVVRAYHHQAAKAMGVSLGRLGGPEDQSLEFLQHDAGAALTRGVHVPGVEVVFHACTVLLRAILGQPWQMAHGRGHDR